MTAGRTNEDALTAITDSQKLREYLRNRTKTGTESVPAVRCDYEEMNDLLAEETGLLYRLAVKRPGILDAILTEVREEERVVMVILALEERDKLDLLVSEIRAESQTPTERNFARAIETVAVGLRGHLSWMSKKGERGGDFPQEASV